LTKYQSIIHAKSELTLTSVNFREVVALDSDSLLYITSADNYVELYWLENGQTKKILLRKTLTEVEKEIKKQFHHIERCHNSYIVNINQIKTISGNSGGYRIFLNNIDSTIPISRKYKDNFLKLLSQ
jgi:DNA-binding LytR/AlgR family response regulator